MSSSANASMPRRPVQCTGTPICRMLFEHDDVVAARGQRRAPPSSPAGPAPTMTTSRKCGPSILAPARFPCAKHANPKRDENQSKVEPPRASAHVEPVVAELLPPRHVARRVDLREAGQPGPHRDAHARSPARPRAARARRRRPPRSRPAAARAARRSSCRRAGCSTAAAARPSRSRA